MNRHYAMIGMAYVTGELPLYYDAVNEKGLCMAGLNFPDNACYYPLDPQKENITPFELLPWILGQCSCVEEALELLQTCNLLEESFSPQLPLTPLHWMLADPNRCVVLETLVDGIKIMDNQIGILTNSPPFPWHLQNLANYQRLTNGPVPERFCGQPVHTYSRGLGAVGLPGDLSSSSRFVRAAFARNCAEAEPGEQSLTQFFHLLHAVEQQRGCVELSPGVYEITRYSSCCDMERGIYYVTTYDNPQIRAVDLHRENLEGTSVFCYKTLQHLNINWLNL